MKGQAAVEYLIMVGIGLVIASSIFYYSLYYSSESIALNQAKEATESIAKAADYVYSLGVGSRTTIGIDIPQRVVESYVSGREVGLKVSVSSGVTDVYSLSEANLLGTLPNTPGRHYISLNMTEDGIVIG